MCTDLGLQMGQPIGDNGLGTPRAMPRFANIAFIVVLSMTLGIIERRMEGFNT